MTAHDPALLAALAKIDTPTICNALEELITPRQLIRFTTKPFVTNDSEDAIFVGYARTAMIRAESPPSMPPAERKALRLRYYEHVATAMPGPVLVVAHGALFRALRLALGHEPNVRTPNALPILCTPPATGSAWDVSPVALPPLPA